MAFAKGNQSVEGVSRRLYKGVGSFNILAVNPTKTEQEKIFGITLDKDPEYTGEQDGVKTVRITFVVKSDGKQIDAAGNPIELITNHTFFLRNESLKTSGGKYMIIDEYGNTAYADKETIEAKAIPTYSNGPAIISPNYRLAFVGEAELTKFLATYLVIPDSRKWVDSKPVGLLDDKNALAECACRLDKINEYFGGKVDEIKEAVSYQPNNKVKIAIGVKTTNDGKQFQATYTKDCLSNGAKGFNKLDKAIKDAAANGSNSVDYTGDGNKSPLTELSEYIVTPTNFNNNEPVGMPFEVPGFQPAF